LNSEEEKFFESLPISKEEMSKRIDECFLDFSLCLPIYEEDTRRNVKMMLDLDTSELIPEWFHDLGTACKIWMPQFIPYLDYLYQAIPYIKGTSNVRPPIDADETLRDDALKKIKQKHLIAEIKENKLQKQIRKAKHQKKKMEIKIIKEGGGNDAD